MNQTIRYDLVDAALGALLLIARGDALCGIHFEGARWQPKVGADWRRAQGDALLRTAQVELDEYLAGERTAFDLPLAAIGTPFQRAVWGAIAAVPYGATIAYGELATRVGRPDAIRAAGAATGRNPWTIVVPCHRIVGADGALTGYAGGVSRKRALLALEARRVHGAGDARQVRFAGVPA